MAAPLKIVDSDHPIKLKYEGAAREPWDRLDDTDEWSIKAQLLLREDYLARLRKMSLPLASSPSQDQDEVDVNNLLQLADLLRNVTVSARARRAILEEEHRHGVRRVKGPFVRWKELEDLREQVKNKEQEDEMLSREMMPKLAKVTVCQHNVHCFRRQDADGDGLLTYKEFLRGLKLLLLPFSIDSHEHVNWILEQVDPQRAGCVSYTAFNMLCENAKKCHSKRRTRWRRLTNNESEPPPATTEEQKDCAEKLVLEKAERDNDKEVVFQDEIMGEKQGDEPAWLVEFNGVARKLGRTRKRIQTLLDDRLNLETEFKAFHAQTPSSPRVAKTAHFEYTESNAKRHEAILKSLKDSIREADSAIGCLREQELALVASLRVLKEQAMRNREILQNQHEELEMARQETRERDQCNKEAKRKRAEERARIKAEEANTPSLLRELIDVNLSDKSNRDCEDMIIHFALRELRVFQGATAMGDDMGTTLFRYGPRQVLVRTVPRGDHAVYRILDARGLAIRLAHCSGTLRSRLERMRAGKRKRTLCNITSKGNESRGSRPVDETVVKMVNSTPPFQELRGTIAVDTAKSGDELRRYLLHAVGRLRANPLTGLVSLAQ
ncbi:Hypothetical Protein FCC1311_005822 [Hondaea fermentalgiana]|uniref:EF-hand domain-containing protein n=1 Tax=Hondaea fermentalgiana TaxID=2315210 RepID=A0A2R5G9K8_9STRA|nr:Hypothetical Protein FCC1311_005822 [Hondaea fermentalgiana]|eukprot:GBG24364.1 Hypothetical Protein FCC1311_005822 [Hondaea fermentalgiana]